MVLYWYGSAAGLVSRQATSSPLALFRTAGFRKEYARPLLLAQSGFKLLRYRFLQSVSICSPSLYGERKAAFDRRILGL